jgi:hypothetical protein
LLGAVVLVLHASDKWQQRNPILQELPVLLVEDNQISTAIVLIENPRQNARPKNCAGLRCVIPLVAKKIAITGRVVAIPSKIPTARVNQRLCSNLRPACAYRNDLNIENRKRLLNRRTAALSIQPPTAWALMR